MSLLSSPNPTPAQTRPRARSHGGLGGNVKLEVVVADTEGTTRELGSWPRRGRRKPPSLEMSRDEDKLVVQSTPWSAQSFQSCSNLSGSPTTPTSVGWNCRQNTPHHLSPLISRFNTAGLISLPGSNPVTPSQTRLPSKTQPVELPGSLLLPSQGFPPPVTPPRPVLLRRSDTDESDLSSLPSLTASISTASPSDNMDLLRGLSHTNWRSATNGLSSNASSNKQSGVSKPISTMSIEELLFSLPTCDSATAARVWLPEMQKKCSTMKENLRKAERNKVISDIKVNEGSKDLKSFLQEVRLISNTYEGAIQSAEALLERDTHTLKDRLQITETQLKKAHAQNEALDALLLEKAETISRLDHTISEVVGILGTFIQRNVAQWVNDFQDAETQCVMNIISDYGQPTKENEVRYLRVPESSHIDLLSKVRRAEEEARSYQKITQGQDTIIKDQSKQLDRQLTKYEQTVKTIQARDHEVTLLGQRNMELKARVEAYETALRRSQSVVIERERLKKENEEMRKEIKQAGGFYKLQLDEKDTKLADLKQKLGSAREEVLARRGDVRNVIAQTQALLDSRTQAHNSNSSTRKGSPGKSPKLFARFTDKERTSPRFPHSPSSLSFGLSPVNTELLISPNPNVDSKYSNKEAISCTKGHVRLGCESSGSSKTTTSSTPSLGRRGSDDPFNDANAITKSIKKSLGAVTRDGVLNRPNGKASIPTGDVHKVLPATPPGLPARLPASSSLPPPNLLDSSSPQIKTSSSPSSLRCRSFSSPSPLPLPPTNNGTRSPGKRRVLSLIPEASIEGSESLRAPSVSSSDQEMYRRSILALDVLNSSSTEELLADGTEGDEERTAGTMRRHGHQQGTESMRSSEESLSQVLTVSQLYHGAGGIGHIR